MKWILNYLAGYGIAGRGFTEHILGLGDLVDVPEEWKASARAWLEENAAMNPDDVAWLVEGAYREIVRNPGTWRNHGMVAETIHPKATPDEPAAA